ncbi:hypothetical protein BGZ83_006266 [Gryganskiella cystojenkinii]|nr:hypothetical protein BGZ83_006266 [Gryganskiella cystojenkinii]
MPSTVDLKAAVETCDALCKFALHYANQSGNPLQPGQPGQQGSETPPGSVQSSTSSSSVTGASAWQAEEGPIPSLLDAQEFANLQMIRRMNTTMLIGLQNQNKDAEVQAASEGTGTVDANAPSAPSYPGETSGTAEALRFGPGPPTHEMVHELAKAATSIFQLAIRIKSWVNMTPEERLLDEEINIIRGKRCLMMDGALTVPTLDRHGNIQKDWAIVPASSSTSKTFHERQREMEQRQSHPLFPILPQHSSKNNPSTANYNNNNNSSNGGHSKGNREERLQANKNGGSTNGFGDLSNRPEHPCGSGQHFRAQDGGPSKAQSKSKTKDTQLKQSKTKDEPHPKYRKRAKRTQPPGRCLSCDSSDTPEWRRGPDGARTLCNACGLHYAKLLKRQGELGRPEYPFHPNANGSFRPPSSSHIGQLQAIKFPLRRPPQQTTATSIAAGSGSGSRSALGPSPGSETQTQAMEGIVREGDANQDYPGGMSDQRHVVGPRISEIQEEEDQPDSEDDDDQSDTKESSSMKPEP